MIYTLRDIVDKLNPVKIKDLVMHRIHFIEEIGEIASIVVRSQDIELPISRYMLSEAKKYLNKMNDKEREEYTRYCSFYRWNIGVVGEETYKEHLESELIDVIMMVGVYCFYDKNLDNILDYTFDFSFKLFNKSNIDVDSIELLFKEILDNMRELISWENLVNGKVGGSLKGLLKTVEMFCLYYDIDVNKGIENKLIELKNQKRSKSD